MPASVTDGLGNTTTYKYAASSLGGFTFYDLAGITFADGTSVSVSFTRDSRGNITSFTDQAGNTWQATYNDRGQIATVTNPFGGVTNYGYDSDATLVSVQLPNPA